jgi:hypothetical protein
MRGLVGLALGLGMAAGLIYGWAGKPAFFYIAFGAAALTRLPSLERTRLARLIKTSGTSQPVGF